MSDDNTDRVGRVDEPIELDIETRCCFFCGDYMKGNDCSSKCPASLLAMANDKERKERFG